MTDRELIQKIVDGVRWINDEQAIITYGEIKALRERLSQPEPEPVAWGNKKGEFKIHQEADENFKSTAIPFYSAPPKKEWIDLTEEEIGEIYRAGWKNNMDLAQAIQAKLKEKNT